MADVKAVKRKMIVLGVTSAVILVALTLVEAFAFDTLIKQGLMTYIMIVPIAMTVLAFFLGYKDINEDMTETEVTELSHRYYIFGGLLFAMSLIAIFAMMAS